MNMLPGNNDSLYTDKEAIDQITAMFFDVFTNVRGKLPEWSVLGQVCIPEVLIIRKSGSEETVYDLEGFMEPRRRILTDGTLAEFEEREVEEETKIIVNLAQRISRYIKTGLLEGVHFEAWGTKCFQLVRSDMEWKICSVIWEDDAV